MVYNGFKCATTTKEKCATENGTFLIKLFSKIQLFLILTVCLALNSLPFGFIWFLHADTTLLFLLQLNYSLSLSVDCYFAQYLSHSLSLCLSLCICLSPSLPISSLKKTFSTFYVCFNVQCSPINTLWQSFAVLKPYSTNFVLLCFNISFEEKKMWPK